MIRYWCVLVQYGAVDRCWMLHHVAASFNALSVLSPTDLPFAISILHAVGEETAHPASEGLPEVSTCCRHLFVGHRIWLHDFQSPKFVENNPPCSERTSLNRFLASTQYSTHTQVARKLNSTAAGYNYREWTCPILKVLVFAAFVACPWMTTPHKITQHSSGKLHIQSGAKGKRSVPSEALRKLQPSWQDACQVRIPVSTKCSKAPC